MSAADSLVDFKSTSSSSIPEKKKTVDGKSKSGFKKGRKTEGYKKKSVEFERKTVEKSQGKARTNGCFICDGPHRARDCTKCEKLNALVASSDGTTEDSPSRVAPIQLLNTLSSESVQRGLMYVTVNLNGMSVLAMLDTGATHNFLSRRKAAEIGLCASEYWSKMKAVNSEALDVDGIVSPILQVGGWAVSVT